MEWFVSLVFGTLLGFFSSRHIQFSHSRLTRTLELLDEFNGPHLQKLRHSVWQQRSGLFANECFDTQLSNTPAESFDESNVIFQFLQLLNFFRKIAVLARCDMIDKNQCRAQFGDLFNAWWVEVIEPCMPREGNKENRILWNDLSSLTWLREGFANSAK